MPKYKSLVTKKQITTGWITVEAENEDEAACKIEDIAENPNSWDGYYDIEIQSIEEIE